ncbi:hypothetical protein [Polaribacter sp.]|uniref:hypothetical protein n=1 Tax=Polaribacter sp. TaxID=1920175 RepID=UPI003F6AA108
MKSKWYFSTLFLILCLCFGAFQDQAVIPNQEIVLEFVDGKNNEQYVNNTILDVKEKLVRIGATNILIKDTKKGTLTISYYATVHVNTIKEALSIGDQFELHQNSKNEQNKLPSSTYNIDIYELTDEINNTNLNDKYVFEIKYIAERFSITPNYASLRSLEIEKANQLFKLAYTAYKSNPFTKERTSNKEPEVRAGPQIFTT